MNQLLEQERNAKLGVKISPHDTTKLDLIHIINLKQMMVKQNELRENLSLPTSTMNTGANNPTHESNPYQETNH